MRLVPRQLRKKSFPSSVPYYGGRMTPDVTQGLGTTRADDATPAPAVAPQIPIGQPLTNEHPHTGLPAAAPDVRSRQVTDVNRLHDEGVLTDAEFATLLGRLAARS